MKIRCRCQCVFLLEREQIHCYLRLLGVSPLPLVPIIHLISQTAASSKAIAATPALSTHRSLDLSEGKGTKDFQSELKALKISAMSCSWFMMIFWLFWADSDSLPVLDLHSKKANGHERRQWICELRSVIMQPQSCEMYPAEPCTIQVLFFSFLIWRHWQLPAACVLQRFHWN